MFEIRKFFDRADFTKQDEASIRTFMESPEAAKIFERAESERIDQRKALRVRLDAIDAKHDKGIQNAGVTHQAAVRAVDVAEANLRSMREAERDASAALYATEMAKAAEAAELREALRDSRDTRLDDFYCYLDDAQDKLRHLGKITTIAQSSWAGERDVRYESNLGEVTALRDALQAALSDIDAMTLLPLSRAEVSERLTAWTHKLQPMLERFSLPTPCLDENGAVTLSRERLKFFEVLQDNGLCEAGDKPQSEQQQAVQAPPVKAAAVKRSFVTQKPPAARVSKPESNGAGTKRSVITKGGSLCIEEDVLLSDGVRVPLLWPRR
ncbi:hypothetical protein [Ralstonia mojiangensis]|uniref:hypothetical protein n=1 Tax=Ralstonia mojiangensis TaxID=2953895 RepID=UPI00209181E2|nr:hypothetical protein [Ralstonia mojiangensis]MCO5411093.1 hypothetical protein [Ralstonia mojiangensis]